METLKNKIKQFLLSRKKVSLYTSELYKEIILNTGFLDIVYNDIKINQRLFHIFTESNIIPSCIECGGIIKWQISLNKYANFCSTKCSNKSNLTKQKMSDSMMERYGVNSYTKSEKFKVQSKQTCLQKYGTEYGLQNSTILQKLKDTNIERYGVTCNLAQPEAIELVKISNNLLYGVENSMQRPEVRAKSIQTNLDRYGVEYSTQNPEILQKIKYTNLARYGVENPAKHPKIREKIIQTNNKKYSRNYQAQRSVSKDTLTKLEDKEWLTLQHYDLKKPLTQIANELGDISSSNISFKFKKHGIPVRNYYSSVAENEIKKLLALNNIEFIENSRSVINGELDIFVPSHNLAIEYNGLYWHSEAQKTKDYHKIKYEKCKSSEIRLIQIFEDEWVNHQQIVITKIMHILGISDKLKIFARKTKIVGIASDKKTEFFNQYHIQGNGPSSVNLGLTHDDQLVAAMGFIKNADGSFTLNRYATSCSVVGGFSKLLKDFELEYNSPKIISFADLRWSQGDLYYKNGFVMDKELKPDYTYYNNGVGSRPIRYHKFNFRHKGMKTKLKNYDATLSETDNMHSHGYLKIYDAGKLKFVKN